MSNNSGAAREGKTTSKRSLSCRGAKCPWENEDPKFRPKHRIFLSIDAIGSTDLKSTLAQRGCTPDVWANCFMAFLPEVEVMYWKKFVETVNQFCDINACDHKCVPTTDRRSPKHSSEKFQRAKVWKYIGDEVVLVAELSCPKLHPSLHVLALAETIKQFNINFEKQPITIDDKEKKLQFKGTAWVAGFPVTNIEIILPGIKSDVSDYLGPSIDLGFRLSKFASQERLVISASLAHLIVSGNYLSRAVPYMGDATPAVPLCFGGAVEAKGVKDGKHPLIWHPVVETEESKLCLVSNDDLMGFFQNDHFKDTSIPPFILDRSYSDPQYYKAYKRAVAEQKKIPNSIFYSKGGARAQQKNRRSTNPDLSTTEVLRRISSASPANTIR